MSTNTSETVRDEGISGSLDEVRPLLRRDVLYADTGQGVFIRHADDAFVLRGGSIYKWLSAIAPHLDGSLTMGDLRGSLPEAQQQMLTSLVKVLLDRGFARDSVPEALGEAVVDHPYASQIEFIRHYVDAPVQRFMEFRTAAVLLVGSGPVADATVRILRDNGHESVTVAAQPPNDAAALLSVDVVVAIGDSIGLDGLRDLARSAATADVALIPAVTVGGRAFVGPLLTADGGFGIASVIARLGAGLASDASADFYRRLAGVESPAHAQAVPQHAAMLGSLIGFEVFRLLTGCLEPETKDATIVQNLETLDIVKEPMLGHPTDPMVMGHDEDDVTGVRTDLGVSPDREVEIDSQTIHEQANGYLDLVRHHTGIFRQFVDLEVDQSPLKVGIVEVGALAGRDGTPPARRTVTGYHTRTPLQARFRALGSAALQYVDTWGPEVARQITEVTDVVLDALDLWSGLDQPVGFARSRELPGVWATSLVTGGRVRVPMAAAYPFSSANESDLVLRATAGAGAGATAAEAVTAGVFSAISYRAVMTALRGATPLTRLDLQDGQPGTVLRFLTDTCRTLGVEPIVLDATLPGCGGTVIAYLERDGAPVVEVATGASAELAAVDALVSLVGRAQTQDLAPIEVGPLSDLDPRGLPVTGECLPPVGETRDVASMIAALGAGTDVLWVDTSFHDLAQGGIRTARVLLSAAAGLLGEGAPQASDDRPTPTGRG